MNLPRWLCPVFVALAAQGIFPLAGRSSEPANPHANPEARRILRYFESLERKPEKRLVSGQFAGFGTGASLKACEAAHQQTGRWPAMIGLDYAEFGTGGLDSRHVNQLATDYARNGGLVTISAHLYNPANPRGGGLRDQGVEIESLLTPGTDTHRRWMAELDQIADGLGQLQEANVVVLWRPFHEMNGGWFWWGAQKPESFIKVWRQMFDHFTKNRGLNNLLWVYGPNHGKKTADYYPGDRFVDIVGLDAYTDFVDPEHIIGYPEVAALPKPFGFTEFGPHAPENPPGDYHYTRLRDGIEASFPRACFFLSWDDKWGLGSNLETRELLAHPWVVNREELAGELKAVRADEPAAESPVAAIRAVLERQEADWNKGDLEAFLTGYWKSPQVVFQSGGTRSQGWDAMAERYRKRYKAEGRAMGQLAFSGLEIEPLSDDAAFARGAWRLTMPDGSKTGGLFTLILRKFPDGWKIVHDHTSAEDPPAKAQ